MLESILGSLVREQVLLFIHTRGKGYSREIARHFDASLDSVQKQLKRLEKDSVLVGTREGKTVVYRFDTEYPLLAEVRSLMEKLKDLVVGEPGGPGEGVGTGRLTSEIRSRAIVREAGWRH